MRKETTIRLRSGDRLREQHQHICSTCGDVFNLRSGLLQHMKLHAVERLFACTRCGKSFRFRHNLTAHERTHTGEKPFVCEVCKCKFSQYYQWRAHQRVVHKMANSSSRGSKRGRTAGPSHTRGRARHEQTVQSEDFVSGLDSLNSVHLEDADSSDIKMRLLPLSSPNASFTSTSSDVVSSPDRPDKVWVTRVDAEYNRWRSEKVNRDSNLLEKLLDGNLCRLSLSRRIPKLLRTMSCARPSRFNAPTSAMVETLVCCHCVSKRFCAPAAVLPLSDSIPPVRSWMQLSHNARVPDEHTPCNLPYVGDGGNENHKFYKDLVHAYDHGLYRRELGEYFSDDTLIDLVRSLHKPNADRPVDIPLELFNAISYKFPYIGSGEALQARHANILLRRRRKESTEMSSGNFSGLGDALDAFTTLFCRRCYRYDCDEHDNKHANNVAAASSTYKHRVYGGASSDSQPPAESCSKSCFLRIPLSPAPSCTSLQVILLHAFQLTYGAHYCHISKSVGPELSCAAVRDFFNCHTPLTIETVTEAQSCRASDHPQSPVSPVGIPKTKNHNFWVRRAQEIHAKRKELLQDGGNKNHQIAYTPCNHRGDCSRFENCECWKNANHCEKFCNCSRQCSNRYPGCKCKGSCDTKLCACFISNRECDPDLCLPCGAADMGATTTKCRNVNIQRGLDKTLLYGPSDVAGWGIFSRDCLGKGDYVAEYTGELITQAEAERRGKVYDRLQCSYLFNLTSDTAVDATRKGSAIRFANHSDRPNCIARVLFVNGDYRIGIFTRQAVAAKEELFFDYCYGTNQKLQYVPTRRPGVGVVDPVPTPQE